MLSNGNIVYACMSGAGIITPAKKIVWALSSWENPDLGPATYIQLLDEVGNPNNGEVQR